MNATKLWRFKSRSNNGYLWIIHYELFWQLLWIFLTKWALSNIFYSRAKVKMRQKKKKKNSFLCSFKKDKLFLQVGAIAPNTPPQLRHCEFHIHNFELVRWFIWSIEVLSSGAIPPLQTSFIKCNVAMATLNNLLNMSVLKECLEKTDMGKVV